MQLDALIHLVQVVKAIRREGDIIVFGSSSLLASYPEEGEADGVLALTYDSDLIPDPFDDRVAKLLDETVGRASSFPELFGYYADIVRPVAYDQFPLGWRERVVPLSGLSNVFCLEPHDMAVAKCLAGRTKDIDQLSGLAAKGKLDLDLVFERLRSMDLIEKMIAKSHGTLNAVRTRADELRTLKAAK